MRKKKKRLNFVSILLLFISIGFASLAVGLGIRGRIKLAKNEAADIDIYFANLEVLDSNLTEDKYTINLQNKHSTTVDASITFDFPGDFIKYKVDVVNDSEFDAVISKVILPDLGEYSDIIKYTVTGPNNKVISEKSILRKNTKSTYYVSIEYNSELTKDELVTELIDANLSFSVKYEEFEQSNDKQFIEILSQQGAFLDIGDEVSIYGEEFYVLKAEEDLTLLSKYNLNVGSYASDNVSFGLQDASSNYEVQFSNIAYWMQDPTNPYGSMLNSKYGNPDEDIFNMKHNNIYDPDYTDSDGEYYSIAYYVNKYVDFLKEMTGGEFSGRILSFDELDEIGCQFGMYCDLENDNWSFRTPYEFLKTPNYWVASAVNPNGTWKVENGYLAYSWSSTSAAEAGVRPVIEVSSSYIIQ